MVETYLQSLIPVHGRISAGIIWFNAKEIYFKNGYGFHCFSSASEPGGRIVEVVLQHARSWGQTPTNACGYRICKYVDQEAQLPCLTPPPACRRVQLLTRTKITLLFSLKPKGCDIASPKHLEDKVCPQRDYTDLNKKLNLNTSHCRRESNRETTRHSYITTAHPPPNGHALIPDVQTFGHRQIILKQRFLSRTFSEYGKYKACEDDVIQRCGAAQQRRVNTVYAESAVLKNSVDYILSNGKC